MDSNQIKKKPIKTFIDNINANKNMFLTRIKIIKQLKENGNEVNIDTIQRVFNVNVIKTKDNKHNKNQSETDNPKKTGNLLKGFTYNRKEKSNVKEETFFNALLNKKTIISSSFMIGLLVFNFLASIIAFNITNNIEYNDLTEQLTAIIYRSIESPQTDICLKSKYDEKTNSIVYYYEVIDHLDSYTYYIKNTSLDNELRVALLEKIASHSKELNNIKTIDYTAINSISLVGHSYIIDNKYKIDESNITGKDINKITSSIKDTNIKKYNKDKQSFILSSYVTLLILEGFVLFLIYKNKKKMQ